MGRRKIEMTMLTDSSTRQVTFSKRRTGLFKKANELATLCGAQIAIVTFSPGGKAFSFGHPTVESVIDRVLLPGNAPATASRTRWTRSTRRKGAATGEGAITNQLEIETATTEISAQSEAETLTAELNQLLLDLEREKDIGDVLDKDIREDRAKVGEVDTLRLGDLERIENSLKELGDAIGERKSEFDAALGLLMLTASEPHYAL